MKRRHPVTLLACLLAALSPFALASCGEEATPPPKAPTRPVGPPGATAPVQAPYGMTDSPSSARPYDQPAQPAHPAMNARAAALYQSGLHAFANGDLAGAKALFGQATLADPRAHQAFYSLGVVQERLRDPGAGASYRQAFTLVPDYEPAIIAYAMVLARKDQLGEAERLLNEKRGQMPKSAAVAATLAEIKSLQKDTGSAQRLAQEALKINPDYRPAMVIIARDHYRNRRLDLALYALQAILDGFEPVSENPPRDRDNAEALLLRGLIYREQGQRAAAIEEFRKAAARRPDLVEARVQLATYLLEAGNAQEALPLLEGAVRFDAEHVAAHLNLGDAYRLLERYADAKREFDWVLARNPNLPQVHYDLGLLYLFAPSIPGMTPKQQVTEAIKSLTRFQELRNKGQRDDSEELLNRAKLKEGELDAAAAAAQPAAPPPAAVQADGGVADAATDT
ncbi:tetratricopeptide repeat protein [Sorangium sp. So ce315]|uniref:tetratricopeptide repeat protein n=1 Tax=Sorangium sp. So ce315 TaxID=3133299 RepID=UPI003F5F7926